MCVCVLIYLSSAATLLHKETANIFFGSTCLMRSSPPSGPLCNVLLRQRRQRRSAAAAHEQKWTTKRESKIVTTAPTFLYTSRHGELQGREINWVARWVSCEMSCLPTQNKSVDMATLEIKEEWGKRCVQKNGTCSAENRGREIEEERKNKEEM